MRPTQYFCADEEDLLSKILQEFHDTQNNLLSYEIHVKSHVRFRIHSGHLLFHYQSNIPKRKEERAPFMKGRSVSLINPSRANDDQQDEQHNNKRKSSAEVITISHNVTASFFISSDYNGILCINALIGMGESTVFLFACCLMVEIILDESFMVSYTKG